MTNESSDELVEKVAIAICPWFSGIFKSDAAEECWKSTPEHYKKAYRTQAKAAIAAMGEGHYSGSIDRASHSTPEKDSPTNQLSEICDDKLVQANWLSKLRMAIHYPDCWDTVNYPTIYDALHELAGCVGCSECRAAGKNPDADQKPIKPVSLARCVETMKSSHYSVENQAKACLDAAGVKYVD